MTWFKVDDGFWSHPKTATLSDAAVTLWVRAGAYCCQHLTDGFVKHGALRLLGEAAAAAELIEVNLWHTVSGGWEFHDWDEYQETSEVVKKRRDDARERQRRHREEREEQRRQSQRDPKGDNPSESRVTSDVTNGVTSQPPTRPDPTRPDLSESTDVDSDKESAPRKRGSRLSHDWMPSQSVIDAMKTECPGVNLEAEHRKFVDHWTDKTGKDATKLDWTGTWRNWIRRAGERPQLRAVVNGTGSTVDDKVNGWLDLANGTSGRELE